MRKADEILKESQLGMELIKEFTLCWANYQPEGVYSLTGLVLDQGEGMAVILRGEYPRSTYEKTRAGMEKAVQELQSRTGFMVKTEDMAVLMGIYA
jgi:hypothetical protein